MLLIYLFFIFIWFLTIFLINRNIIKPGIKHYVKVIIYSFVIGISVSIIGQICFAFIFEAMHITRYLMYFLEAFIPIAFLEEFIKFTLGKNAILNSKTDKKIDFILMMGCTGIAFQFKDALIPIGGTLPLLILGVFPVHILWQFWMGAHFYEYLKALDAKDEDTSTKEWKLLYHVPMLLHGTTVFLIRCISSTALYNETLSIALLFVLTTITVLTAYFSGKTIYTAIKETK